jgi:hypothetical protein
MKWLSRAPGRVELTYQSPRPEVPQSEIEALRQDRRWFDLLLATTTPDLHPRSQDRTAVCEALNRLGLGRRIDPSSPMLGPRGRELAEFWRWQAQAWAGGG